MAQALRKKQQKFTVILKFYIIKLGVYEYQNDDFRMYIIRAVQIVLVSEISYLIKE